jgi:hypothetical protein
MTIAAMASIIPMTLTTANAGAPAGPAVKQRVLAIELGAPFRDNAVLQRDMKVPVWGWSDAGNSVTVEFAGQPPYHPMNAPSITSPKKQIPSSLTYCLQELICLIRCVIVRDALVWPR